MNRFIVLALVALSCALAAANPILNGDELESSAINPTDDEETAHLDDRTRVFADFCITTRGLIFDDIKRTSNGVSSKVFNTLFNTAENIETEALNQQKEATGAIAEQIRNPDASFVDDGSEISAIRKLVQQERNVPKTLLTGFFNVIKMTAGSVSRNVLAKFNEFKSQFGMNNLSLFLSDTCVRVADYEKLVSDEFEKFKSTLVAHEPAAASIQIRDVQCLTSRRVIRVDGMCKLAAAAKDPFMQVTNLKTMRGI